MYVRKEAVLSSQIEGTQSTLTDLLRFETDAEAGQPMDDIREVSNYVDAMMFGLTRLQELPLSLRLIREMHARLLHSGRGETMDPGEFRRSQNWVGGTRPGNALYVPPPTSELNGVLHSFERFMHEETSHPPSHIKAGLLHVQFETIHPFLDGNGRIGRLLITFYLCVQGVVHKPLLYLSLYLKTHRTEYYRLLQDVRERGMVGMAGVLSGRCRRNRESGIRCSDQDRGPLQTRPGTHHGTRGARGFSLASPRFPPAKSPSDCESARSANWTHRSDCEFGTRRSRNAWNRL
jgi:Fic family protein